MSNGSPMDDEALIDLNRKLLEAIARADWSAYEDLCDPGLTCFEPETQGHLIEGLEFHRIFFEQGGHLGRHVDTIVDPHVWRLGEDGAAVAYTRLVQRTGEGGGISITAFHETRVWRRTEAGWKHVHFHRSVS